MKLVNGFVFWLMQFQPYIYYYTARLVFSQASEGV